MTVGLMVHVLYRRREPSGEGETLILLTLIPAIAMPWVETHGWDPATANAVLYVFLLSRGLRSHLWRSLHPRLGSGRPLRGLSQEY